MENGFFARMCKEAAEELANGQDGWRDANPNVMMLACFHLLTNHMAHTIKKPLWFAASCIAGAALIVILKTFSEWVMG